MYIKKISIAATEKKQAFKIPSVLAYIAPACVQTQASLLVF